MASRPLPPQARMDKNTIPEPMSGCFLWIGAATPKGYGCISVDGHQRRASRVAWALAHGPIPDGQWVLHSCDNPACVNVLHLHLGDNRANMKEMVARGRSLHRQKTHCPSGHGYTLQDTIVTNGGQGRQCRLCKNAYYKRRRVRLRAKDRP